jgi:hypothetical protein
LAVAQIVGSPRHAEHTWFARQWQLNLLTGAAAWSTLSTKINCRWAHDRHWRNLQRLPDSSEELSLAGLFDAAGCHEPANARLLFSHDVATRARCTSCCRGVPGLWWLPPAATELGTCTCGGTLVYVSFWNHSAVPAGSLREWWPRPLAAWGVPGGAIIAVEQPSGLQRSFVVGSGSCPGTGGSP